MIPKLLRDVRGATIVEFTVTLPFFLLLTFGIVQAGLLLMTLSGLQHGVELAARCASVNYSASQLGLSTSCFGINPSTVTVTDIEQYAQQHSFGLIPSYTYFNAVKSNSNSACGTTLHYLVTASYTVTLINYIFAPTFNAQSCFPIS